MDESAKGEPADPHPPLAKVEAALVDSGRQIKKQRDVGRLPPRKFTRPNSDVSHWITDGDLMRLQLAAAGNVTIAASVFWGAFLASIVPASAAIIDWNGRGLAKDFSTLDLLAMIACVVFLGMAVSLTFAAWGRGNISQICKEIRERPQSTPD